jgi:hypothetical protein
MHGAGLTRVLDCRALAARFVFSRDIAALFPA